MSSLSVRPGLMLATVLLAASASACGSEKPKPYGTAAVVPARAEVRAGTLTPLTLRFTMAGDAAPLTGDHLVFVHANGANGELLWTDDHVPPRPLAEWKAGTTIEYTREMLVPAAIMPGPVTLSAGLYAPATGEKVPMDVAAADGKGAGITVTPARGGPALFLDGWHAAEMTPTGDGWRWTRQQATVALPHPRRDATLVLVVDQPSTALSWSQEVVIAVGDTMVDTFSLAPGAREIRRVQVPSAAMGTGERTRVSISVAKPFVPQLVPALNNPDGRELGVRVFGVYFDDQ